MTYRTDRPIGTITVLAVITLSLVVGCGSSPPAGTTTAPTSGYPTPTPTTPSPASPTDEAKRTAIAAYLGMWWNFVAASDTSDWQSPKLGQYTTGVALTNLSRGLYADHYNGVVTKGEPTHSVQVSSADPAANPTKVVVTDCSDSSKALKYRADNGQLADNTPGGRRLINGIVEKQADGSWKVSDFGVHEVGSC